MRGLLACLIMVAGQAAADTCAPIGSTGYLLKDDEAFTSFEWGKTMFFTWYVDTPKSRTVAFEPEIAVQPDLTTTLKNGLGLRYAAKDREVIVLGTEITSRTAGFLEGVLGSDPPMMVRCRTAAGVSGVDWCLMKLGQVQKNSLGCEKSDE